MSEAGLTDDASATVPQDEVPPLAEAGSPEVNAKQAAVRILQWAKENHLLPTSWSLIAGDDEFTGRMLAAVNGMLLDMLAAIARKDYVDRRRRQAEGIAKAKAEGRYKGRPGDERRNAGIATMLRAGSLWARIEQALGCSRNTIARVRRRLNAATTEAAQA